MRCEFPKPVYAQIVLRATNELGQIVCEGCGLVLGKKTYHVDHTIADGLFLDKKRKLTTKDGKLLGEECCHKPKTKIDVANIARAKRREAKHLGITKPAGKIHSAPFPKADKPKREGKTALPFKPLFRNASRSAP